MTTEKQLLANQTNALVSTGPKTLEGKAVVSANPIKHGIFVAHPLHEESEADYHELLDSLKNSLAPQNQMESLLVEKITIDFWRLRRVLRFEAGSIQAYLDKLSQEFYTYDRKTTAELAKQIESRQQEVDWIDDYIEALRLHQVDFDKPTWEGDNVTSEITADLYLLARNLPCLSYQEKDQLPYNDFIGLKSIIEEGGYVSKVAISKRLVELYAIEKKEIEDHIAILRNKQVENEDRDRLHRKLASIPNEENADKVLKYERSLQRSIYENLFLLKKLQKIF